MTSVLRSLMRRLLKPLWILLALVFLFEAWLWDHLQADRRVDRRPHRVDEAQGALRGRDRASAALPDAADLPHPAVLLFPFKLLGLWMLAHGSWLGAMAVLVLAKVVGMGVTAFIFEVTRPKLLQLPWFRWLYEHLMVWLDKAHAHHRSDQGAPARAGRAPLCADQAARAPLALAGQARPPGPLLPPPRAPAPPRLRAARGIARRSVRLAAGEQRLEPVQHVVQHVRR